MVLGRDRATARRTVPAWPLLLLVALLAQCLAAAYRATAAAPQDSSAIPAVTPGPSTPVAPTTIPVTEVATRAAQVPDLLRSLTQPVAETAETELIKKRLQEARMQMEVELAGAEKILGDHPTLDVIQLQQQLWQQRQLQMTEWLNTLTRRAMLLQDTLIRLTEIKETWRRTRETLVASDAPTAILAQVDGALAAIEAAERSLTARRIAVLDLQSVLAQAVTRSAGVLAGFIQAQHQAMGGLLGRDSPPLWSGETWTRARGTARARVRELAAARWDDIVRYVRDPSRGMPLHGFILVGLVVVFLAARRQPRLVAPSDTDEPGVTVFDRPYAAALLITLLVVSAPLSSVPQSLRNLAEILLIVPVIRLTRPAIDPRLAVPVYAAAVLFMLDGLRQAIGGAPVIEQSMLTLEMLAGIMALGHSLTSGALRRPTGAGTESDDLSALRVGLGLVLLVLAAGLAAAAVGYLRLARLLASIVFGGGALALTLYASIQVAAGLVAFVLNAWPLRLLRMVQDHRVLLERRAYHVLLWAGLAGWASRLLDYAGLFQPAQSLVLALLGAKLGRGAIRFSVGDVLEFVVTVWLAYLVSAFVRFVLREDVYPRLRTTQGIAYAVSNLLNYVILTLGLLLALGAIGLDVAKVTILAGALGVGLGFGLQSIVNNFVSGLILLFERPIRVGDIVEVGTLQGTVSRIGIRASRVRTFQGADIIVPNAQLVTERVTNWTASDYLRRIEIPVGVDYGSAPEKVVEVLKAVAQAHPEILKQPPPQAVFKSFGDSAINFELRAWTDQFGRWPQIQTDLAAALYAALREAGMAFPFPQREVRLLHDGAAGPRMGTS